MSIFKSMDIIHLPTTRAEALTHRNPNIGRCDPYHKHDLQAEIGEVIDYL